MAKRNYYEVLGVPRNIDDHTLRKTYKKLALRWHPDKNPDNQKDAEEKFKEISEAYHCLIDTDKRVFYSSTRQIMIVMVMRMAQDLLHPEKMTANRLDKQITIINSLVVDSALNITPILLEGLILPVRTMPEQKVSLSKQTELVLNKKVHFQNLEFLKLQM